MSAESVQVSVTAGTEDVDGLIDEIEARIDALVAGAPPFTDEQREILARILTQ